jgi:Patatin-like phospholipase
MAANADRPRLARRIASGLFRFTVCVALYGCAVPERLTAVPENATTMAEIRGIPNARFFPETQLDLLVKETREAQQREIRTLAAHGSESALSEAELLAVSGGGADGAFGAGLLAGWSVAGTRPVFKVVTGVSTGALTAPFAFLGSDWDKQLAAVYTQIRPSDIFKTRFLSAALWDDGLADTGPLARLIARYADQRMLDAIAAEYRKGRLLFIGTTNIDAGRPVIWNMGAIAGSGQPGALDLFRKVLLASAAIPAFFPPVLIDVEVDGRPYQEMHVDGGTFTQMFLYPSGVNHGTLFRGIKPRPVRTWLIRNGRFHPFWANVSRRTLPIAEEAIASMVQASGSNDVSQIYFATQRDGVDYNLAYIDSGFTAEAKEQFDPVYMRALYDYGYGKAVRGYPWAKRPPWISEGQDTGSPAIE